MRELKTIDLKGKKYVQVNERVAYFNEVFEDGMITTEATLQDNTVYFKATIFTDSNKSRFYTGHSFGELGKEKALEKLETVAVGRALAFMGIGIVESIASSDEMTNFQNKELVKIGFCNICGEQGIKSKSGRYFCPNWKDHKSKGEKWELKQPDERSKEDKKFAEELDNIPIINI